MTAKTGTVRSLHAFVTYSICFTLLYQRNWPKKSFNMSISAAFGLQLKLYSLILKNYCIGQYDNFVQNHIQMVCILILPRHCRGLTLFCLYFQLMFFFSNYIDVSLPIQCCVEDSKLILWVSGKQFICQRQPVFGSCISVHIHLQCTVSILDTSVSKPALVLIKTVILQRWVAKLVRDRWLCRQCSCFLHCKKS